MEILEDEYKNMGNNVKDTHQKIEYLKQNYNELVDVYNNRGMELQTHICNVDKMDLTFNNDMKLYNSCDELINKYADFIDKNKDKIYQMKQKFEQEFNVFETRCWEWTENDLIIWVQYKLINDNIGDINWENVLQTLKKVNIKGSNLDTLANNSLYIQHLGIMNIEITVKLHEYIKELINKHPKPLNDDEKTSQIEGDSNTNIDIPSEYICPLSNKIMNEPVRAYDNIIYDKQNILNWFNDGNKTSPKIKDKDGNPKLMRNQRLIPILKLQQKIREYNENKIIKLI